MATETSPTLGLPMVDGRCSDPSDKGKNAYRMFGSCRNCQSEAVGLFTEGHETSDYYGPRCPACACQSMSWLRLEDAESVRREVRNG